jgi:hypothetical protein
VVTPVITAISLFTRPCHCARLVQKNEEFDRRAAECCCFYDANHEKRVDA